MSCGVSSPVGGGPASIWRPSGPHGHRIASAGLRQATDAISSPDLTATVTISDRMSSGRMLVYFVLPRFRLGVVAGQRFAVHDLSRGLPVMEVPTRRFVRSRP